MLKRQILVQTSYVPRRMSPTLQTTAVTAGLSACQRAVRVPSAISAEEGLETTLPGRTLALFGLTTSAFRSKAVGQRFHFILEVF